jgi:hypothetical protein
VPAVVADAVMAETSDEDRDAPPTSRQAGRKSQSDKKAPLSIQMFEKAPTAFDRIQAAISNRNNMNAVSLETGS